MRRGYDAERRKSEVQPLKLATVAPVVDANAGEEEGGPKNAVVIVAPARAAELWLWPSSS